MNRLVEIAAALPDDDADRWFTLMEDLDRVVSSTDLEVDPLSGREFAERMYAYNPSQPRAPRGTTIGGQWVKNLFGRPGVPAGFAGGSDADRMMARRRARQERGSGTPAFQAASGTGQVTSIPRATQESPAVDVGEDVNLAVELLAQGRAVSFRQPRGVNILLDRLAEIAADAKAKGMEAPVYDLCNVTLNNTNLFCVKNKGIPRIQMPQLMGVPEAGSRGDLELEKDKRGEVDLLPMFLQYLQDQGATLRSDEAHASHLLATQNELDGRKVAGIMDYLERGGPDGTPGAIEGSPLLVTEDNYIIDGHHRWAAQVGYDAADNDLHNDPVMRLTRVGGMDILDVLREAMEFGVAWGIRPQRVDQSSSDVAGPQTNDSPPTYEMTDEELEVWGLASTEEGRNLRWLPGTPLSRREERAMRRRFTAEHIEGEIGHIEGPPRRQHLLALGPDEGDGLTFSEPYTSPDGTVTYSVRDGDRSLGLIRERNGRFEAVLMGRRRGSSRTMSSVGTFSTQQEAVDALRPRDLSGRVVQGPEPALPSAARTSGLPLADRRRMGVGYWESYDDARRVRDANPGSRIVSFERGYAVQLSRGGDYVGPDPNPQQPVGPTHVRNVRSASRDQPRARVRPAWWNEPSEDRFFVIHELTGGRDRPTKGDEIMDWLDRNPEIERLPDGRYRFYHGAPAGGERDRSGTLRAGSLLETDPEMAAYFASRDRGLDPDTEVVVRSIDLYPEEIIPGVWASLRGEQPFGSASSGIVGVSPSRSARSSRGEVDRYFSSPRFRNFEAAIDEAARNADIAIEQRRAIGFWRGDMEASAAITFDDANLAAVNRMAGELGRRYNQDAVAVFRSSPRGRGARYSITAPDPDAALAALEAAGIEGATIRGNEIVILDTDGSLAAAAAQVAALLGVSLDVEPGEVRFLEHGRDYEEDRRPASRRGSREARRTREAHRSEARPRRDRHPPG